MGELSGLDIDELIDAGRAHVGARLAGAAGDTARREVARHPQLAWLLDRAPWSSPADVERGLPGTPLSRPAGIDGLAVVEMRYLQAHRVRLAERDVVGGVIADLDRVQRDHPSLVAPCPLAVCGSGCSAHDDGMFHLRRSLLGVLVDQQPTSRMRRTLRLQAVPGWEQLTLVRAHLSGLGDGADLVRLAAGLLVRGLPLWLCETLLEPVDHGVDVLRALQELTDDSAAGADIVAPVWSAAGA